MKQLKFLLMAFAAMCLTTTVMAQKTKTKTKTKKETTAAVYQCPMKCEEDKTYTAKGKCPVCNMNLKEVKKEATVYQCPMKCEADKTYGKEGKCPVCNMNLKAVQTKEKKKEDHSGHSH